MRFSRSFEASPHCLPSPHGKLVATLSASAIHIRAVDSMRTLKQISLPREFSGPVAFFEWSSSSRLILVASADQIHVFSVLKGDFHATIRSPVPPAARPVFIGFGPTDTQVCICASLGLRFAVFDLVSSKTVEIANTKSYTTPSSTCRGFSFRPGTRHLTILTRISGKDAISIHHPVTKEVQRSWFPDTIDAQGLIWSSDGKWLVTWEAAAHGHKVLLYTSDGNLFKAWSGPQLLAPADADIKLGPGVRVVEFSGDSLLLAIGDSSRRICILNMASVTESLRLQHPNSVAPTDTLQVWQEQIGSSGHHFVRALQTIYPPNGQTANTTPQSGCSFMAFDVSSALLATKYDDAPSTIWIWDTTTAELRAVLLFHGNILKTSWHPTIRETLLIVCEGDSYNSLAFIWDPLSDGPKPLDFSDRLSNGKLQVRWLNVDGLEPGTLFASDSRQYLLASLAVDENEPVPWEDGDSSIMLNDNSPHTMSAHTDDEYEEETSELNDTFCFKKAQD